MFESSTKQKEKNTKKYRKKMKWRRWIAATLKMVMEATKISTFMTRMRKEAKQEHKQRWINRVGESDNGSGGGKYG